MMWAFAVAVVALAQGTPTAGFDGCAAALRAEPHSRSAARCFFTAAQTRALWTDAARWLEEVQRTHPTSGWITFYLAEVRFRQLPSAAHLDYRSAVGKFTRMSDAEGEVEARAGLGAALFASGKREEAWDETQRMSEAARKTGDSLLIARAMIYEARHIQETGERLARGLRLLLEAEPLAFPRGNYALKRDVLLGLGNAFAELGRYEHALSFYSRLGDLARENQDVSTAAIAAYNAITARRKQMEVLPEAGRLPELIAGARDLVALADDSGQPARQARAHRTLGDLLASDAQTRAEAGQHYRFALDYARRSGDASERSTCLWVLGRFLSDEQPAESRRLIDEALREAVDSGRAASVAYAWRQHLRLAWKTSTRDRAAQESLQALRAIETLRSLQSADQTRAAVFGVWTLDYHWLIGKLLETVNPAQPDVALAFEVSERMRARLLLDTLLRQPSGESEGSKNLVSRRQQLLRGIADAQRRLLDPRLEGAPRSALILELERLERQEEAVRTDLIASDALPAQGPAFPPLERVERALGENEAMLAFSVGLDQDFYDDFGGAAWVLVITSSGTRVVRVPDRVRLHPMLSIFLGLAEHADAIDTGSSVKLYDVLLREALSSLPAPVNRLIIVPDGPLHHLPFSALRPGPTSPPLGTTHEIAVVPSATVWMHLRAQPRPRLEEALVFADPSRPAALQVDTVSDERSWWPALSQLGALPHSREEGRAVVSSVGGASRMLAGADAREAALKTGDLGSVGIVHFATHSVVDEAYPDRSAIILAGDESGEDGLLQAREIADLSLGGRLIVLSACRSATGAVLAGEGVMGLSRAFFEAGASTVVGTLWTIRDDHAAEFFHAFYRSLRLGHSVGAALADARRHAIANGIPASAWSSIVVMGDDTVVTVRATSRRVLSKTVLATIVVALLVLAAVVASWFRRPRTAQATG